MSDKELIKGRIAYIRKRLEKKGLLDVLEREAERWAINYYHVRESTLSPDTTAVFNQAIALWLEQREGANLSAMKTEAIAQGIREQLPHAAKLSFENEPPAAAAVEPTEAWHSRIIQQALRHQYHRKQ